MRDAWRVTAIAIAFASVFALGYAINGLAEGITELPRHWWSTAPVVGLLVALGMYLHYRATRIRG